MISQNFNQYIRKRQKPSTSKEIADLNHATMLLVQLEIPRSALKRCKQDTTKMIYHFYCYTNLLYVFFETLKRLIAYRFEINLEENGKERGITKIFSDGKLTAIQIKKVNLSKYLIDLLKDQSKHFSKKAKGTRFDFTHQSGMQLYTPAYFFGKNMKNSLVDLLDESYILLHKELDIIFGYINKIS